MQKPGIRRSRQPRWSMVHAESRCMACIKLKNCPGKFNCQRQLF
ncbi:hypothetical protein BRYFOR_08168 [Marvinbryantia formatexigens DSM 14469]|uniref:Uncharacterized protein n=1 Tax=Marvinbryantia formatexigens DSM 14469 TaxID=478749 RepID=C6LHQ4_9FIRM|nr:hypothetical protein BRYFOR_08168 [Marvinbryantia formatexigens DSM 14469]